MVKHIHGKNVGILLALLLAMSTDVNANTLTCGLKTITLSGNTITKLVHEDGTIHTGGSISNNWTYDGKSIKHRLMDDAILCGTKAKSRDEVIAELSGSFSKNPKSYDMSPEEARLMGQYTAKLMRLDNSCYLLVDAAKSPSQQGIFYIDCNDMQSQTRRYWVTEVDLKDGVIKKPATPVSSNDAISICNSELKARTTNPSTYDPSLILGTSNRSIERNGRNVVKMIPSANIGHLRN